VLYPPESWFKLFCKIPPRLAGNVPPLPVHTHVSVAFLLAIPCVPFPSLVLYSAVWRVRTWSLLCLLYTLKALKIHYLCPPYVLRVRDRKLPRRVSVFLKRYGIGPLEALDLIG